jgi:hypothetical protein
VTGGRLRRAADRSRRGYAAWEPTPRGTDAWNDRSGEGTAQLRHAGIVRRPGPAPGGQEGRRGAATLRVRDTVAG